MKVVAVVGTKKTGKTTLVESLVRSLKRYGHVGTIKNMQNHPVDKGDTKRHFEAGAEEVLGLGKQKIKITRKGNLESAILELNEDGMDFVIVEGFKSSNLPKIVLGGINVPNTLCHVEITPLNVVLLKKLTDLIISLDDYKPGKKKSSEDDNLEPALKKSII